MFSLIYAQSAGAPGAGGAAGLLPIFGMLAVMIAVMYFIQIRPQNQAQKEKDAMLAALAKGDTVVTIGGICGTITHVSESHVVVEVDKNTSIKFVRRAIAEVKKPAND